MGTIVDFATMIINTLTLGVYQDIISMFPSPEPVSTATALAWALIVVKWGLAVIALLTICYVVLDKWLRVDERLGLKDYVVPGFVTVAIIVGVLLFINTPWHDAEIVAGRTTAFTYALSMEEVNYTPTMYSPIITSSKIPFEWVEEWLVWMQNLIPTNYNNGVAVDWEQKPLPAVNTGATWDLSILKWVVYIALIAASIVITKYFLPPLGIGLFLMVLLMALPIPLDTVATIFLIIIAGAISYFTLNKVQFSNTSVVAAIPIGLTIICLMYLLQPPQIILLIGLVATFILLLFPWFYALGLVIFTFGTIRESRSHFGMKRRPAKYIDEYAGSWDATMVGLWLTLLFTAVMVLFSITLTGLGVFATTSFKLFRAGAGHTNQKPSGGITYAEM